MSESRRATGSNEPWPATRRWSSIPLALVALLDQWRSTRVVDAAAAVSPTGAAGGASGVVAEASGVKSESPAWLVARTRYEYDMPGSRPLSLKVWTPAGTTATWAYAPSSPCLRSTLNPVSLSEWSVQVRSIWLG